MQVSLPSRRQNIQISTRRPTCETDYIEPPFDLPDAAEPVDDPDDPSDLDGISSDPDDGQWDVFIPDDDECDPQPDPRDYWNVEHLNDE